MTLTSKIGTSSLEAALEAEAKSLEQELEASAQFRRLKVVRQALESLTAIGSNTAATLPPIETSPSTSSADRVASSIPQAVLFALEEAGQPLSSRHLIEAVQRYGRTLKSKQPVWALSNTLSTDKRFQSVPWGEARAWWFADRAPPGWQEVQMKNASP